MLTELDFARDADLIGHLRYEVFVRQLGWPVGDHTRLVELDHLDAAAHHLGVINQQLDGYVRFICGGAANGMLLQQPAFAPLCPPGLCLDQTTGEISRLCVRPGRAPSEMPSDGEIVQQLTRGLYDLATRLGRTTVYATTSDTFSGYVNRAVLEQLTFEVVAGPHQFEPDINTYLMKVDVARMSTDRFARAYLSL